MRRNGIILIVTFCLAVLSHALRAEGYVPPAAGRFAASSAYYVTLQDADGTSLNAAYAQTSGAIGAFVDGELRGVSSYMPTGSGVGSVFVVRVWGDEDDPSLVQFRIFAGGVERVVGTHAFGRGEDATYGRPSQPIILTLRVEEVPAVTLTFSSAEVTLSKLRDGDIRLQADGAVQADLVQLLFSNAANGELVAVAQPSDDSGLRWSVRGRYVGQHTVQIVYNGEVQAAKCRVNIPAEYQLRPGWDWVSFYAIGPSGQLLLRQGDTWLSALTLNENYRVFEIRSQQGVLRYDAKYGYFGTIDALSPAEGAYKIYNNCDEDNDQRVVINVGSANLLMGDRLPQPQTRTGYTWVTYPHETDHSVAMLAPYLKNTAEDGDMIIGRTGFATFDDGEWVSDGEFCFEAGQGYIYYTAGEGGKTIDWGPATLKSEALDSRRETMAHARRLLCNYPETMPVVAILQGVEHPDDYVVRAFVGDECRGEGRLTTDGSRLHISVAGAAGETVSFRLYDKREVGVGDMYTQGLALRQQLAFAPQAGSHRHPVMLDLEAIDHSPFTIDHSDGAVYDLQGRKVVVGNASERCKNGQSSMFNGQLKKGVYITNGKKIIK